MKLALSRAILRGADILLLDEPTNHLDVRNVAWPEHHANWKQWNTYHKNYQSASQSMPQCWSTPVGRTQHFMIFWCLWVRRGRRVNVCAPPKVIISQNNILFWSNFFLRGALGSGRKLSGQLEEGHSCRRVPQCWILGSCVHEHHPFLQPQAEEVQRFPGHRFCHIVLASPNGFLLPTSPLLSNFTQKPRHTTN